MKQLRLLQVRTAAKSSCKISKFNAWQVLLQCICSNITAQLIKITSEIMWRALQIPVKSSSSIMWCWKDQDSLLVSGCLPGVSATIHSCNTSWDAPGVRGTPGAAHAHHTWDPSITFVAVNIFSQHILWVLNTSKPQPENLGGREALLLNVIQEIQNNVKLQPQMGFLWH